jgi:bifunctional DNase/RNase
MPRRAAHLAMAGITAALIAALVACARAGDDEQTEVRVRVGRVVIDDNDAPVVVLEEEGGTRMLPIWIGSAEAHSIALEMEQLHTSRPNTHDLVRNLIERLDAEVARVVVTDLREGTYYATLNLVSGGHSVQVDARPSDAIAIALRTRAPIFVRASLFERHTDDDAPDEGNAPRREI